MSDITQTLVAFVVALGVLVTVHEFGHYWVARRLGVKILRFSIGFGRPLVRWCRGETEFVIAAVPLGGYVKMLDEREGEVASDERHRAFNRQPLATRFGVVSAGPLANFLLAIAAYWLMLMLGVSAPRAIIGEVVVDSPAARAGLEVGDEIVQVDGELTATWDGVFRRALAGIFDQRRVALAVVDANGGQSVLELDLSTLTLDNVGEGSFFSALGMQPLRARVEPAIGRVIADGAAARADLQVGDRVVATDGVAIDDWSTWVDIIRRHPGHKLRVRVERAGRAVDLELVPEGVVESGALIGRIGAEVRPPPTPATVAMGIERYGPLSALGGAFDRTWEMSATTLRFLGKMILGEASVRNLSGPISIAHYAGASAKLGVARFLEFLALVSVSLAVLNLLPVPLLDGGHLLYYLIEFVTRRPVSESLQAWGQQIGLVVLLSLMGLAVYNDIMRML